MLFNSYIFALFLPIVFLLYWSLQNKPLTWQNTLLLIASYIFYGWWDPRFLILIFISSIIDYSVGHKMHQTEPERQRKWLLAISLISNLGVLGLFKYFNFFIDSFASLVSAFGLEPNLPSLHIILPVGISFYTFQTLSYTIDVYRRKLEPTNDIVAFFTFVSFFPQLVAGPIERASHLLPQFTKPRHFDMLLAKDGVRQILWGLFKKVVVADNLAVTVDLIFGNFEKNNSLTLILGVFYFAIQIYCDFSGYSDIAIGVARLFGFDLMRNFAFPYFSRDIGEFWRRWHISLSTWFRDYLYIPLGGSRTKTKAHHLMNLVITFTISGFWHGANWTFVVWGLLHGFAYLPLVLMNNHRRYTSDVVAKGRIFPSLLECWQMTSTFMVVLIAWVFFRATSIQEAFQYLYRLFVNGWHNLGDPDSLILLIFLIYVIPVLLVEWLQRDKEHALQIDHFPRPMRWIIYYAVALTIFLLRAVGSTSFIYFQF
ncbi:MAG: MBOAT family protein [Ardenticatenaceae bacterium]|nr:MBOAT family protein [Ardenticatenaceae bacterium]